MSADDAGFAERAFLAVTPVIPAADVAATIAFYVSQLDFTERWRSGDPPDAAGIARGNVAIHLFASDDPKLAQWTSFRIETREIEALYDQCERAGIVHPSGALEDKPWGSREFTAVDPNGVCVVFWQQDDTG